MTSRTIAATIAAVAAIVVALVSTVVPHLIQASQDATPPSGRGATTPSITTSTPMLTPIPESPSILITTPKDGDQVTMLAQVLGTAQNIPGGEELWLFIVPSNQTSYFPQHGPIKISDGQWSTDANFGGANDTGLNFRLIPVLIRHDDKEVHALMADYFRQTGPMYRGILLTSGMQLLPGIIVER